MAKYIDAEKLKNTLKENIYPSNRSGKTFNLLLNFVIRLIDDTPTADVVEVVRCKECKHWCEPSCQIKVSQYGLYSDDYCSYGERKTDD